MGKLSELSERDAASLLVQKAHELAANRDEGSLLGALLEIRVGEDFRTHVRALIGGLGAHPVINRFSLRDAYAMIAAMHAENQLHLSRDLLAFTLGCRAYVLESAVLDILRREAKVDLRGEYIMTRHRRIAEEVCSTLREDGYDAEFLYVLLALSSRRYHRNQRSSPLEMNWPFELVGKFIERGGRWVAVAERIARALRDAEVNNRECLIQLSRVLRRSGRAGDALIVLTKDAEQFLEDRSVLSEWSVVAGAVQDYGLQVWLVARSLSDLADPLDHLRCKHLVLRLARAFEKLDSLSGGNRYVAARAACGHVGLRLSRVDADTARQFERFLREAQLGKIDAQNSRFRSQLIKERCTAGRR